MENELFWLSMSSAGYASYVARRVQVLTSMSNSSDWLDRFSSDMESDKAAVFKSMRKAIEYQRVHEKQQRETEKEKALRSMSDSDDDSD